MNPSLCEGPGGVLLCAFQDEALSGRGSTSLYNDQSGRWESVGLPGNASAGRDWWPKMALDHSGEIFRVNYDYGLDGRLGVRRLDLTSQSNPGWILPFGAALSSGQSHTPDLEIDSQNRLIISYQDGPGGNGASLTQGGITVLRVNPQTGQSVALGHPGFSDDFMPPGLNSVTWHTQVERAADGTIYAAWSEKAFGNTRNRLYVARYSEVQQRWKLIGSPGLDRLAEGINLSLELDASGVPVVAYRGEDPVSLRVLRWIPGTYDWEQIGDDIAVHDLSLQIGYYGFSPDGGYRESVPFTIDALGRIYIACRAHDAFGEIRMKTWRFEGAAGWQPLGPHGGFLPGSGDEDYGFLITSQGTVPVMSCRRRPGSFQEQVVVHRFY
ncbi:hypothetical protein Poly30_21120 [Planctomycetes bacterium Poly30]|uniref:Uncharacterized protein n=1 Tax=Saltatorellus ferox TaxID=2528018 RepID=A0A518ER81_9BACT|nr:hypothetical protein Poly30_21120 [Planctomycetes bacterium Poly30]